MDEPLIQYENLEKLKKEKPQYGPMINFMIAYYRDAERQGIKTFEELYKYALARPMLSPEMDTPANRREIDIIAREISRKNRRVDPRVKEMMQKIGEQLDVLESRQREDEKIDPTPSNTL
jgi:hypothetical protein